MGTAILARLTWNLDTRSLQYLFQNYSTKKNLLDSNLNLKILTYKLCSHLFWKYRCSVLPAPSDQLYFHPLAQQNQQPTRRVYKICDFKHCRMVAGLLQMIGRRRRRAARHSRWISYEALINSWLEAHTACLNLFELGSVPIQIVQIYWLF